ncbi:MFS transporter, partial [Blastococcus mobilis]|uniref:MFS transporter n=1 Tax=Blastococcus mobilis TaxID=1938746 RepID=UPI001130417A
GRPAAHPRPHKPIKIESGLIQPTKIDGGSGLSHALDRRIFTGAIGWLTAAAALASLAFITFTSAVPLWLVDAHHLRTDAPLLGGTLGLFSLGAGLGAVAGGAVGARFGYARTTAVSLLAAVPTLTAVLIVSPGVATLVLAASAGALIYASQPLLISRRADGRPTEPGRSRWRCPRGGTESPGSCTSASAPSKD